MGGVKTPPAKTGMKTILTQIEKLKYIRRFQIDRDVHFAGTSDNLINSLAGTPTDLIPHQFHPYKSVPTVPVKRHHHIIPT
jgi:hypothetical protein